MDGWMTELLINTTTLFMLCICKNYMLQTQKEEIRQRVKGILAFFITRQLNMNLTVLIAIMLAILYYIYIPCVRFTISICDCHRYTKKYYFNIKVSYRVEKHTSNLIITPQDLTGSPVVSFVYNQMVTSNIDFSIFQKKKRKKKKMIIQSTSDFLWHNTQVLLVLCPAAQGCLLDLV